MAQSASFAGIGLLALLSGCAGPPLERPDVEAEAAANPEVALQRSLGRVGRAMADLDAVRAGRRPVVPGELQRPVTWRWSGPLDEAAKALAERVGYSYAPPGPDAPVMPTVAVDANGTPVIDVLRSIGAQAGQKALLVVDPDRRIVQVQRHV